MAEAKPRKKIAIITGASAGLGTEFALQIERNYFLDEIWLIARREDPMRELAGKFLKSRGVVLALDLTRPGDLAAVEARLREENPEVRLLVNNAGYGKIGPFADLGLSEQMRMVELNVNALTFLSHVVLPYMQAGSGIIQVASSIAFVPAPYFAVYAATKAYVLSLSEAIGFELRGKGIQVIAVCPGPVATEFFSVARTNEFLKDHAAPLEPANNAFAADAGAVVAKALSDLDRGRRRSIYGVLIKAFAFFVPHLPRSLILRLLGNAKKVDAGKSV
jgi:uncharacterized protein